MCFLFHLYKNKIKNDYKYIIIQHNNNNITMSSATYLISIDTLKTVGKGALGAMSFGAYHQFNTNKMMELNNEIMKSQQKQEIEKMREEMREEIKKIKEQKNIIWWGGGGGRV